MKTTKYFSGKQEVKNAFHVKKENSAGCVPLKLTGYSGNVVLAGYPLEGQGGPLPITRVIFIKENPSMHKCGAKCRHAKGSSCDCECGGQFHGAGD
jgi:hypothetical protein